MTDNLVAIIPAGEEQEDREKNIRHFYGIPIIQRSIELLLETNKFSDIFVSTDNQKIADIAMGAGAKFLGKDLENLATILWNAGSFTIKSTELKEF